MKTRLVLLLFSLVISNASFTQCIDESWHNTSFESSWLSCSSKQNPLPGIGNTHWILYQFEGLTPIESFNIWNLSNPELISSGIKVVRIDYSPDGATWSTLGNFELEQGQGNKNYSGQIIEEIETFEASFVLFTALSTYGGACAGLSEVQFNIGSFTTSTQDEELKESLTLSPNPADGFFKVHLNTSEIDELNLEVFNLVGQRVYQDKINMTQLQTQYEVPTSNFPEGQYFIRLYDKDRFVTEKITVVHLR